MTHLTTVDDLDKTTFSGRRFTRTQLRQVQDTVDMFKNLNRTELARTICDHLAWTTPNGKQKIASCRTLLEQLEKAKLITLPALRKEHQQKRKRKKLVLSDESRAKDKIECPLEDISPIEIKLVESAQDRQLWNEFVGRHHYMGYSRPFGAHLRYFIIAKGLGDQKVGCILYDSAAFALASRDQWIGWNAKEKNKKLNLIINQGRFLIFPWIKVFNLASKALSLSNKRVALDWQRIYNYTPVLLETFVDTTQKRITGASYKAANWQFLGQTAGRGRSSSKNSEILSKKDIYVYPLNSSFRTILKPKKPTKPPAPKPSIPSISKASHFKPNNKFNVLWQKVIEIVSNIAASYDQEWQIRKRIIDSMMLVLLIFRIVSSKNKQGYGTTIDELWDNCERLQIHLPKKTAIAPSSFADARAKLNASIFQDINTQVIAEYEKYNGDECKWQGHRLFAVDGTKIHLPRELRDWDYKIPTIHAQYPQGLVSCLYQLKTKMPFDFELVRHENERECALSHMKSLAKNDVVVYDRGYFSYAMLYYHYKSGVDAIFRISENSFTIINEFIESEIMDQIVLIDPTQDSKYAIKKSFPDITIVPLSLRLTKYKMGDTVYYLGTTLLDASYKVDIFPDVYHARWGIEELYKVSKRIIEVEDFHSKSELGVKQEIYAQFTLITMNRIFSNQVDGNPFISNGSKQKDKGEGKKQPKANFKNCLSVFVRNIESLLIYRSQQLKEAVAHVMAFIAGRTQVERPDRKYVRKSMKPANKWKVSKNTIKNQTKKTLAVLLPSTT